MQIEKINLSHQKVLKERFSKLNVGLSEFSFANLYLFRNKHQTEVWLGKHLYIVLKTYDHVRCLMPTIPPEQFDFQEIESIMKEVQVLFPIPEIWKNAFPEEIFTSSFREEDHDYIFSTEKLADLSGRQLSAKRNLEKQFKEHFEAVSYRLNQDHVKDCLIVLEKWQTESLQSVDQTDYRPCLEALQYLDILGLEGKVFYVKNQPIGFLIGEKLTEDMFVLHFVKADTAYKGVYPYIYQTFAEEKRGAYRYFNMEQDLGIPGLQQAKRSYHPEFYNVKLRVTHWPKRNSEDKEKPKAV